MTEMPLPPDAPIAVKDPSRLSLALQSDFIYTFKRSPIANRILRRGRPDGAGSTLCPPHRTL